MGLRTKFNLAILGAFLIGFGATSFLQLQVLWSNARADVIANARVMMAAATAIRNYTTDSITPLVGYEREGKFLSVSVPSYAAHSNFRRVQAEFPEYSYKEATLNPTNPADRAVDWEADIIRAFRSAGAKAELVIERETPTGPSLVLAKPLVVGNESCLVCHSVPGAAPEAMTKIYGTANGFGWKLKEIVGAQIVSLPLSVALKQAQSTFLLSTGVLATVFVLMAVILNVMLHYFVTLPVTRMSNIATKISLGDPNAEEISEKGKDEVAGLAVAFNRMRRSLERAIKLLDEPG